MTDEAFTPPAGGITEAYELGFKDAQEGRPERELRELNEGLRALYRLGYQAGRKEA